MASTWVIVNNSDELEGVSFKKDSPVSSFTIDGKKILIKTDWIDSSSIYVFKNNEKFKEAETSDNNKHRITFNNEDLSEWYKNIITKLNKSIPDDFDMKPIVKFGCNFKMPGGKYDNTYLIVQRDSIQEVVKFADGVDLNLYRILKDRKIRLTFEVLFYNSIEYNKLKSITVMWDDKIENVINFNKNSFKKKESYKDKIKKSNKTLMNTILHE